MATTSAANGYSSAPGGTASLGRGEGYPMASGGSSASNSCADMRPRRFGLKYAPPSIVVEWLQPSTGKKFIRRIELAGLCPQTDPAAVVEELRQRNGALLGRDVAPDGQLLALVAKLLDQAVQQAPPKVATEAEGAGNPLSDQTLPARDRRKRIVGLSLVARASKRSKEDDIVKAFKDVDIGGRDFLCRDDLLGYFCDYLGFGQSEIHCLLHRHGSVDAESQEPKLALEGFRQAYATLNPYMLDHRHGETIVRKPGSLGGQALNLDTLEDCEVYACDTTAQVFVDECKRCLVLLGPCESSVFVRDCEDCTFWIAAQQLRTRNCKNCLFLLYSKTEPIIEASEGLAFAPWAARYPGCSSQFEKLRFDPHRNMWNALFDFSGKAAESNWRILPLLEVIDLRVELDDPPETAAEPDNPCPEVTHAMLCADPLESGESCGQGMANIPQSRPALPAAPPAGAQKRCLLAIDEFKAAEAFCGIARLQSEFVKR